MARLSVTMQNEALLTVGVRQGLGLALTGDGATSLSTRWLNGGSTLIDAALLSPHKVPEHRQDCNGHYTWCRDRRAAKVAERNVKMRQRAAVGGMPQPGGGTPYQPQHQHQQQHQQRAYSAYSLICNCAHPSAMVQRQCLRDACLRRPPVLPCMLW